MGRFAGVCGGQASFGFVDLDGVKGVGPAGSCLACSAGGGGVMLLDERALRETRVMKFLAIFECPVCGFDSRREIERCPHCLAFCMRWVLILRNVGIRRSA